MRKYRSIDERVLQRLIDNSVPGEEFVSRTRARSGLLSVSAQEFDECLERHNIHPEIDPVNRGQRYRVQDILSALTKLLQQFETKVEPLYETLHGNGRENPDEHPASGG